MTAESFLDGRVVLHAGDCLDVLKTLAPNSIDSCVCDPPYHLTSIVKRFGAENASPAKSNGATGVYARASSGFMGKKWDGGDIAFRAETWAAVFRVLKPGAYLVAFSGTRTYHRMACAIEDAGFEVRDSLQWLYGSGFPKSLDVSKALLRTDKSCPQGVSADQIWSGFGTALKPAMELICLARKPLIGTVAQNILKHGTGALNIDGCRVATEEVAPADRVRNSMGYHGGNESSVRHAGDGTNNPQGRWPAKVIHDGSDEVVGAFPETADSAASSGQPTPRKTTDYGIPITGNRSTIGHGDSGSAARFFYTAKADADDRLGSKHPTVKPLDLMQWLVRLVTPPKGLVLDPFAGTGTTGEAAWREGMRAVLIEREPEYQDDIRRRMAHALAGPQERKRTIAKAKNPTPPNDGLFASLDAGDAG